MIASKKLMKPELRQHLEDFELKVNLDETSMLELRQNNPYMNAKDELAKLKGKKPKVGQGRNSAVPSNVGQDVEMQEGGAERDSRRRSRADYEQSHQQLAVAQAAGQRDSK